MEYIALISDFLISDFWVNVLLIWSDAAIKSSAY